MDPFAGALSIPPAAIRDAALAVALVMLAAPVAGWILARLLPVPGDCRE